MSILETDLMKKNSQLAFFRAEWHYVSAIYLTNLQFFVNHWSPQDRSLLFPLAHRPSSDRNTQIIAIMAIQHPSTISMSTAPRLLAWFRWPFIAGRSKLVFNRLLEWVIKCLSLSNVDRRRTSFRPLVRTLVRSPSQTMNHQSTRTHQMTRAVSTANQPRRSQRKKKLDFVTAR